MKELPVFAFTEAIATPLQNVLKAHAIQDAIDSNEVPRPILRHWTDNPHHLTETPRVSHSNGGFRAAPPPARINIYPAWLQLPYRQQILVCLHELCHADAYRRGLFDIVKRHCLMLPVDLSNRCQAYLMGLYDNCEEIWVTLRTANFTPSAAREEITAKIMSHQSWRTGQTTQQQSPTEVLLATVWHEYFFAQLSQRLPRTFKKIAKQCREEARVAHIIRTQWCAALMRDPLTQNAVNKLLRSNNVQDYWDAFVALSTHVCNITVQYDHTWATSD